MRKQFARRRRFCPNKEAPFSWSLCTTKSTCDRRFSRSSRARGTSSSAWTASRHRRFARRVQHRWTTSKRSVIGGSTRVPGVKEEIEKALNGRKFGVHLGGRGGRHGRRSLRGDMSTTFRMRKFGAADAMPHGMSYSVSPGDDFVEDAEVLFLVGVPSTTRATSTERKTRRSPSNSTQTARLCRRARNGRQPCT